MEEIKPGWTNGTVTLRDPVEAGWDLNTRLAAHETKSLALRGEVGNLAVVHCNGDGEIICNEEADILMFKKQR